MPALVSEEKKLAHPDGKTIRRLFDAITDKYDFLNSFLSFGLDRYWRSQLAKAAVLGNEKAVLDLGVGTGASLEAFLKHHSFERAVGCDFSENMLKRAELRLRGKAELFCCDFHNLPFPGETFDIVTGSFVLRSVQDMEQFVKGVFRVLKPGGRFSFLELTRVKNQILWNFIYQPYLRFVIPFFGSFFSRHDHAYDFLSQSIQTFMDPERLGEVLRGVGFSQISLKPLCLGAVTIIQAAKESQ